LLQQNPPFLSLGCWIKTCWPILCNSSIKRQHLTVLSKKLVSWCLTSLLSTNIWLYQGQKLSLPIIQFRKASDILTSTLAAFLFNSHPKRERDREAHLHYYTSTDNRERHGTILVEWEDMKSKKIDEAWIRKGKKEKILKDREKGGEVMGYGGIAPGPHRASKKLMMTMQWRSNTTITTEILTALLS